MSLSVRSTGHLRFCIARYRDAHTSREKSERFDAQMRNVATGLIPLEMSVLYQHTCTARVGRTGEAYLVPRSASKTQGPSMPYALTHR
jgi:hypothetical protein